MAEILEAGTVKVSIGAGVLAGMLAPKTFKSGSVGFYGQGKLEDGAKRYQVSIVATLIGSKPKPAAKAAK